MSQEIWYAALAEDKIFFGKAPRCERYFLAPDLIRDKLSSHLSLSSLKTEVYLICRPIRSPEAAAAFCEDKKHVRRGDFRLLEGIRLDLS